MRVLIKAAKIVAPGEKLDGKTRDLLIVDGVIEKISTSITDKKATEIKKSGLHVSAGWFDMCANFCDPGFEYKEDIPSGLKAAARGGFTEVLSMPTGHPAPDSKSGVEYAENKSQGQISKLHVAGALSAGRKGKHLSEMYEMHEAGALCFGDYKQNIERAELMHRALEYSQNFDGLILEFPMEKDICPDGSVHEGPASTAHGLKGIPSIAESMRLFRDLSLLEYTQGKMHVQLISCSESVDMLRASKKQGLRVSAGIAASQLSFTDEGIEGFDTNFKVLPPYRSGKDRNALIKGLKEGIIDVICSDHTPEDVEQKKVEFDHAAIGISNIETAFASVWTAASDKIELGIVVKALTTNPRTILGLPAVSVVEGTAANLTLFCPEETFKVEKSQLTSRSKNNPFVGKKLKGSVKGIILGKQMKLA